jgi:hypothetical protein
MSHFINFLDIDIFFMYPHEIIQCCSGTDCLKARLLAQSSNPLISKFSSQSMSNMKTNEIGFGLVKQLQLPFCFQ